MAWKQDVSTVLRKAEESFRRGKLVQAIDQTLAMLREHPRPPLRLGKAAGKPVTTDRPRHPANGEIFMGQCLQIEAVEGLVVIVTSVCPRVSLLCFCCGR